MYLPDFLQISSLVPKPLGHAACKQVLYISIHEIPFPCFIFDADKTLFCLILKAHLTTQILLILCKGLPLVVDDKKDSRIWYRMGKTCKERVGQRGLEGWGHLAMETWSLQDEQKSMTHINHSSLPTTTTLFSQNKYGFFSHLYVHLIHLAC